MALGADSFHALSVLEPSEATALVAHLESGCALCRAELAAIREATLALELGELENRVEPSATPALKQRLLRRLGLYPAGTRAQPARRKDREDGVQVWRSWLEPAAQAASGIITLPASSERADWLETGLPGVRVRRLAADPAQRSVTMMVRMEAGSSYPAHRHADLEQCYVIAGDLQVEGRELQAGDFQTASAGSVHGVQSTNTGCTLLILSWVDDELCPPEP